ncbi:ABC transporter permease [Lactococcus lactis]|uniref:ABC transporter permease n=1 Tax=Lactococcus lactis TaxID=1358 RepID=UPI001179D526|nr:ABC transporter permease [Lactococcus lactis]TRW68985.1 ABC transporter permease [Lactococcus lactis]
MRLTILNNSFVRLLKSKTYIFISVALILVTVAATGFVVNMKIPKAEIGVTQSAASLLHTNLVNNKELHLTEIKKNNDYYQNLILGKFDAYISKEKGKYEIVTVRNASLGEKLNQYLNNGKVAGENKKRDKNDFKVILTVLTMSLMILSLILYKFYFDDREGIDKRIYLSGITNLSYVIQYFVFNFLILGGVVILGAIIILPIFDISLSWNLVVFLLLIAGFSASFGMMLSTITRKNQGALLIGTMLTVLTMLLSGALFDTGNDSQYLLPQHYISNIGKFLDGNSATVTRDTLAVVTYTVLFIIVSLSMQNNRREQA